MKPRSRVRGPVLFVTVGSTRFDKLIAKLLTQEFIDYVINLGFARLVLQIGQSDCSADKVEELKSSLGHRIDLEVYDYKSSIADDIERADLIVGHAGAGTCLEVLRANKRLLIVANDSLMNDHQSELADQLASDKYVVRTSIEDLNRDLKLMCNNEIELNEFSQKDSSKFEEIFEEALNKVTSRL